MLYYSRNVPQVLPWMSSLSSSWMLLAHLHILNGCLIVDLIQPWQILNKQRKLKHPRQFYTIMVIKTKSIFDPSEENDDGIRVLVTRFLSKRIKKNKFYCWIRELSRSADLLNNYREGKYIGKNSKLPFFQRWGINFSRYK